MRSRATAFGAPTSKVAPSRPINPAGRNQVSRSARLTSPRRASSARVAAQTCRLESPTSSIVKSGASARSGVRSSRGAGRMGTPRGGSGRGGPGSRGWGKPSRSQRNRISRTRRGATNALPASTASQTAASSQPQPELGTSSHSRCVAAATSSKRAARSRSSLRSAGVAARSLALRRRATRLPRPAHPPVAALPDRQFP